MREQVRKRTFRFLIVFLVLMVACIAMTFIPKLFAVGTSGLVFLLLGSWFYTGYLKKNMEQAVEMEEQIESEE